MIISLKLFLSGIIILSSNKMHEPLARPVCTRSMQTFNCFCSSYSFPLPFPSLGSCFNYGATNFQWKNPSITICYSFNNLTPIKASMEREDKVDKNDMGFAAKGSGTSARGRRLLKLREEKHRREQERLHNYPSWAKVLEDACKNDVELRAVLGDSIGNPELMRKRVEERVRKKGRDFQKSKTGSVVAFKVSFREDANFRTGEFRKNIFGSRVKTEVSFNPLDSYIWVELFGSPSDRDVDLFGSVIQAWYVMGRLGAFNSSNLQLVSSSMEYNPLYDAEKALKVMPSSFHDISDVEFQDNWGRFWVDLGTSDAFAIDVLLNSLTVLSSEYLGIQQVVFGGRKMGDWEEGMTSSEYGYKFFKI